MADSFRDIIPPERRGIRNIEPGNRHRRRPPSPLSEKYDDQPPQRHLDNQGKSFFSRFGLWIIVAIIVFAFALSFSLLFSGSKIIITPFQQDVLIEGTFEAVHQDLGAPLSYELINLEQTASKMVPATGEEAVEERSRGQIVIFNDFSSAKQRLITNTRFETPEGLIYRINEPTVVPGQQEEGGKVIPGSVEVTVYADEPGESYNIGLTDFTIPGFKGGPRFDKFYARSKTTMSGGFVGARLTADEATVAGVRRELQEELSTGLIAEAQLQKPGTAYLFDNAVFITFTSLPSTDQNRQVEVKEMASFYGMLFDKFQLAEFIAANTVARFDDSSVEIDDVSTVILTVADKETLRPWEGETIPVTFSGTAHLIWLFDEDKLKADLAGRTKEALPTILSGYPSIERAKVVLRPFWKRTFPENISKINIERMLDK